MATTPARLRNWAGLVLEERANPRTVANMLLHCAKRFENYEARIEKLEDECAALLHLMSEGETFD